jgi:putative transposase
MTASNQKPQPTGLFSPDQVEQIIVSERLHLYNRMKPCGAAALRRHLHDMEVIPTPSVGSIGRILAKHCLTHGRTGHYPEDHR